MCDACRTKLSPDEIVVHAGVPVAVARLVPDANGETDLGRWEVAS